MTVKEIMRRLMENAKQPNLGLLQKLRNMVNDDIVLTTGQNAVLDGYLESIAYPKQSQRQIESHDLLAIATWINSCGVRT